MQENQIPVVPVEQPKQSNFLVVLLSVLLLLSVSIAGFFAFQTQKLVKELTLLRVEPTPTIEPVATDSATIVDLINPKTGWLVSTSKEMGFSFEYPPTWDNQKFSLQSKDGNIKISYGSSATGFECYRNSRSVVNYINNNKIIVDYLEGVSQSENCDDRSDLRLIVAKFTTNSKDYIFTLANSKSNQVEAEKIFDQILSTFKFLN